MKKIFKVLTVVSLLALFACGKENAKKESKEKVMAVLEQEKYENEGKAHLRIGLGCSGGQHRSVAFINKLYKELSKEFDYKITYYHREVGEKEVL